MPQNQSSYFATMLSSSCCSPHHSNAASKSFTLCSGKACSRASVTWFSRWTQPASMYSMHAGAPSLHGLSQQQLLARNSPAGRLTPAVDHERDHHVGHDRPHRRTHTDRQQMLYVFLKQMSAHTPGTPGYAAQATPIHLARKQKLHWLQQSSIPSRKQHPRGSIPAQTLVSGFWPDSPMCRMQARICT